MTSLIKQGGDINGKEEMDVSDCTCPDAVSQLMLKPLLHNTCHFFSHVLSHLFFHTEDVGDEGEEEKECITYNVSVDIHYGIKSNR